MANKKEKHTTYTIGPVSRIRLREELERIWRSGGSGRLALQEALLSPVYYMLDDPYFELSTKVSKLKDDHAVTDTEWIVWGPEAENVVSFDESEKFTGSRSLKISAPAGKEYKVMAPVDVSTGLPTKRVHPGMYACVSFMAKTDGSDVTISPGIQGYRAGQREVKDPVWPPHMPFALQTRYNYYNLWIKTMPFDWTHFTFAQYIPPGVAYAVAYVDMVPYDSGANFWFDDWYFAVSPNPIPWAVPIWRGVSVTTSGLTYRGYIFSYQGYNKKTIYLDSDQPGTLYIYTSDHMLWPRLLPQWKTAFPIALPGVYGPGAVSPPKYMLFDQIDTVAKTDYAGNSRNVIRWMTTYSIATMMLKFVPTADASDVNMWVVVE